MPFGLTVPGRLGADPEIRTTKSGATLAQFRVAVDGYGREAKQKTTTWVRVTMWGARGEQIAKLVSKGDGVCFMGTGELKSYQAKTGGEVWYIECTASECALMGRSQKKDARPERSESRKTAEAKEDDFPPDW